MTIGKYGSFSSNAVLGRPYYLTFEISDEDDGSTQSGLRIVSASELHSETVHSNEATPSESRDEPSASDTNGVEFDIVGPDGELVMRSNRLTVDLPSRQTLSMEEIEALKRVGTGSGKEIIAKIMANHMALDEKTKFSLAKYTLRKTRKYMKRFTVLPLDVGLLTQYILDGEAHRVLEIREEMLGLIASWANARHGARLLVVDDTGGLILAALAEKMGILFPGEVEDADDETAETEADTRTSNSPKKPQTPTRHTPSMSATNNSLTLIHSAAQPNLGLLRHFGFDTNSPSQTHPLYQHLKTLSWLQLLHPEEDDTYQEPTLVSDTELQTWKSGKRGTYYKKRRRWERIKRVVDEARSGNFDSLVVASTMDPTPILKHTIPLLKGGAQICVYSPDVEKLTELTDLYSRERRVAYMNYKLENQPVTEEDFPLDPTLLLAPTLQTSRVRRWQVLPGRTHPMMMDRGGSEGYLFTATRVLPVEGPVSARGKFSKRKKVVARAEGVDEDDPSTPAATDPQAYEKKRRFREGEDVEENAAGSMASMKKRKVEEGGSSVLDADVLMSSTDADR